MCSNIPCKFFVGMIEYINIFDYSQAFKKSRNNKAFICIGKWLLICVVYFLIIWQQSVRLHNMVKSNQDATVDVLQLDCNGKSLPGKILNLIHVCILISIVRFTLITILNKSCKNVLLQQHVCDTAL